MSETTVHHINSYPDAQTESVKVERNSKGFNFEVKAPTVERACELIDDLQAELAKRQEG
jgi:hypothetical protein